MLTDLPLAATGEIRSHPVVETTQKDNICHTVLAPAQISAAATHSARKLAEAAINSFDGAGIYGVEMFITGVKSVSTDYSRDWEGKLTLSCTRK
jgi:phosphoribosylaminoimidazole carboxylase (NCAIR synthetase)